MSREMTSCERFRCIYDHREPDRVPITDIPWRSTVERWRREGLPPDADLAEFFGWDRIATISIDNSPRYPERVLEETEEYLVTTNRWGTTLKDWKHSGSVPEFIHHTITDPDSWRKAKARMQPDASRIDWDRLKSKYPAWRQRGYWIEVGGWFGYDPFAAWIVGVERMLVALLEQPEWCIDMFRTALELDIAMMEMLLERGYEFHAFVFPDDLGYRNGLLFSPQTYREVLKPVHRRAIEWCHARGIKVMMHSCGNITALLDDLVEIGLDGLNPFEVKAGMDILDAKRRYGDRLVLQGGIDVRTWTDPQAAEAEIAAKLPILKAGGGYVFHSDHSIPESVSLQDYQRVLELVRRYGRYE